MSESTITLLLYKVEKLENRVQELENKLSNDTKQEMSMYDVYCKCREIASCGIRLKEERREICCDSRSDVIRVSNYISSIAESCNFEHLSVMYNPM